MKRLLILMTLAIVPFAHAIHIQRWQTPHGSQVLFVERHELPIVDFAVLFRGAGNIAEPEGKSNVASATAHLLTRGTNSLSEEEINQKINELGSNLSSHSQAEYTSVSFRSLVENRLATAQLLNQVLTQPRFDETVLERMKNQAITGLQQSETYPSFIGNRALTRLNYPDHPYGKNAFQTVEKIQSIQSSDLKKFHQKHYAHNNAIIVIVGDLTRTQAEELIEHSLKNLPAHATITPTPKVPIHGAQKQIIDFPHTQQSHIFMGLPILTANHPDYFALMVGNYILGDGGFDSRLMKVLRDQHGLTYGASSDLAIRQETAPFTIYFSTEQQNTDKALKITQDILKDWIKQGATETELKQAQAHLTGNFPLQLDTNAKLINQLMGLAYYQRPDDWLDTYTHKINQLTVKDIQEAWQRHLKPEQLNLVIVQGDGKK